MPCDDVGENLYRVIRKDESCDDGLISKDSNVIKTLTSHVEEGSTKGYVSQFISFTSTMEIIKKIGNKNPNKRVVSVKVADISSCTMYNFTDESIRKTYLLSKKSPKFC